MKNNTVVFRYAKLPLSITCAILATGAAYAESGSSSPSSLYPFAPFPLGVEQSKINSKSEVDDRVKPNVMFLVDDTGSMKRDVAGNEDYPSDQSKTRISILRNAMDALLTEYDPDGNNFNYYFLDLCWSTWPRLPEVGQPLAKKELLKIVNNEIKPRCGGRYTDHSLEGFYEAVYFMRKNMNEAKDQYRCQTNSILFFSDGEMNYTAVTTDEHGVPYAEKQPVMDLSGRNTIKTRLQGTFNLYQSWWDCGYDYENDLAGSPKCRFAGNPDWKTYLKFSPNQDWRAITDNKWKSSNKIKRASTGIKALGGPADWIKENDLVTEPRLPMQTQKDAAGKSWDDKNFKKQTIDTFSIGLGVEKGGEYLDGAAASADGHKAILAQSPEELIEGFKNIFAQIQQSASLAIPEGYSYTSPATLGSKKLSGGIGVYLADGLSQSALRFFPYIYETDEDGNETSKGGFNEKVYQEPDYSSKKLFVNWKMPAPKNGKRSIEGEKTEFYDFSVQGDIDSFMQKSENSKIFDNSRRMFEPKAIFGLPLNASNEEVKNALIPWLVKSIPDEEIAKSYSEYRIRPQEYPMGDIVDSPVVPGGKTLTSKIDCSLPTEVGSTKECNIELQEYLVTSANDGMTYVFKRNDNVKKPYQLSYRYLPMQMDRGTTWEGTNTIASNLYKITRAGYSEPENKNGHLWLNNGGITVRTVELEKDANQQTFMVATPGQGGRGIYGLQVGGNSVFAEKDSQPLGVDKPDLSAEDAFIFDTPKGWYNDSGYIIGNPGVARMSLCRTLKKDKFVPDNIQATISKVFQSDSPWSEAQVACRDTLSKEGDKGIERGVFYTAIYGSGFDSPASYSGQYGLEAKTALSVRQIFAEDFGKDSEGVQKSGEPGTLIRRIAIPDNQSGLAMPTVVDMDYDGVADLAYAATTDGDLYRFDFRASDPSGWSAVKIFSTPVVTRKTLNDDDNVIDDGTVKQPVMVAPSVYRYVSSDNKIRFIVTFGTGRNLYNSDLKDRTVQSIYSIEDRPQEEKNPVVPVLGNKKDTNYLVERSLDDDGGKRQVQELATKPDNEYVRGWYANLDSTYQGQPSGERIVQSPIVTFGASIYSSVMYVKESETDANEHDPNDPCKVVRTSTKDSTKGWVMIFNAKNGDAPDSTTAKLNVLNQGDIKNEVGLRQDDGGTGLSLFLPLFGEEVQKLATNPYGQIGSGLDSYTVPPYTKDCIDPSEEGAKLIGQNRKGLKDTFDLSLPLCPSVQPSGSLMRLNFRKLN